MGAWNKLNSSTNSHAKKRMQHMIVLYRNTLALLSKQACFSFKYFKPWNIRQQFPYSVSKAEKRCSLRRVRYLLSIKSFEASEWNTKSILLPLFRSNSIDTPKEKKGWQNLDKLIAENAIKPKG